MTKFISKENIVLLMLISIISVILTYYSTENIDLKIAFKGYGPQNYVSQKLHPENFKKDFMPKTISVYDNSVVMRIFPILKKNLDIDPSSSVYPYMFIQTLLFLMSIAFLTQTMFKNNIVTIIALFIVSVSNLTGLNLARFGNGYSSLLSLPLFYGYANAFRFFAIAFFLRNKYIWSSLFLVLCVYCHINIGLFATLFIGAYFLYNPKLIFDKKVINAFLMFMILVVPYVIYIISNASIHSGGVPDEAWIKSTKIFGFHWYPITMRMFSGNSATNFFFPLLMLSLFFPIFLRYLNLKEKKNLKIICGCIFCIVLTIFGVIVSEFYPIPFFIKIAFHRSSSLISFFSVLYCINYLYNKINNKSIVVCSLAIYSLLVLFFSKPGLPLLPLIILLHFDIKEGSIGCFKLSSKNTNKISNIYYFVYVILFLLVSINVCEYLNYNNWLSNKSWSILWAPLQNFNPLKYFDFLLWGGRGYLGKWNIYFFLIIVSILVPLLFGFFNKRNNESKFFFNVCFSIILCLGLITIKEFNGKQVSSWNKKHRNISKNYLDVQLWAKDNTSNKSLFMPDPTHYYGWRDFSQRSSFGNFREWGYCGIAYTSDLFSYKEGLKRMKAFGVGIEKVTYKEMADSESVPYWRVLNKVVRQNYYNMPSNKLKQICEEYKIDYFIMNRKYLSEERANSLFSFAKIAYENDNYKVFSVN